MIGAFPPRGFVVEVDALPRVLPRTLEAHGLVFLAARTLDGLYFEPTGPFDEVLNELERQGHKPRALRRAGSAASWHAEVRGARLACRRLANRRAAEWLPTFHTA